MTGPLDAAPKILGIPLNRILTIARGPINVVAGTVATWLLVHVHLLGLFHLQHDGLSAGIAQGVVWLATAILTDRGIAQWVKGHHIELGAAGLIATREAEAILKQYLDAKGDPADQATTSAVGADGPADVTGE